LEKRLYAPHSRTHRPRRKSALAAYVDGADFDATVAKLAGIGRVMEILLG
jgi:hypothetical protein